MDRPGPEPRCAANVIARHCGEFRREPRLSLGMLPLARRDVERLRQILGLQRRLVDMNLSPDWVAVLTAAGHDALHWSAVGNIRAVDVEIMAWARQERRVVFTHDLDFGTILALTQEAGPSVLQVRTQDVTRQRLARLW